MNSKQLNLEELTQVNGGKIDEATIRKILLKLCDLGYSRTDAIRYLINTFGSLDEQDIAPVIKEIYPEEFTEIEVGWDPNNGDLWK